MRIKLTLAYDGTSFHGWQVQPGTETVQGVLENALEELLGQRVKTYVSGRTDEGVSAYNQVVHFDCQTTIPPEKIYIALNFKLPPEIRAKKSEKVADDFNARYDVVKKTYRYRTYVSDVDDPTDKFALRLDKKPDVELMKKAAKKLLGEHDFKAFCAAKADTETSVRTLYRAEVIENGNRIDFVFTGSGFLYNMVRIMVGTLIFIGLGIIEEDCIEKAFQTLDRKVLGKTVKPHGLFMESVEY